MLNGSVYNTIVIQFIGKFCSHDSCMNLKECIECSNELRVSYSKLFGIYYMCNLENNERLFNLWIKKNSFSCATLRLLLFMDGGIL